MKALLAIFITLVLLAVCCVASAMLCFDLSWILIVSTSLWAAIDSTGLELTRYKTAISYRPLTLFCVCFVLWILAFPWYLWTRLRIKDGSAVLKMALPADAGLIRRFFHRSSRIAEGVVEWCLIGMVTLIMGLLLFCLEEDWRGPRAWAAYRHELEAKGESFDWNTMIPPRVPDGQNFFSAPMMSAWFLKPSGQSKASQELSNRLNYTNACPSVVIAEITEGRQPPVGESVVSLRYNDFQSHLQARQLLQNIAGPSVFGPRGDVMLTAQRANTNQIKPLHIFLETDGKRGVKDLAAFFGNNYAGAGPLIFRPSGSNSWQLLTSFSAASDYLAWSERFNGDFALMREAVKRPYARMEGDYQYPPTIPLPNYLSFRAVAQMLAQRAQCRLLLGQPEEALKELTLLNDLRHVLEGAPTRKPMSLVATMMNTAIVGLYADVIADGIRLRSWKDPQLVALQRQLEKINLTSLIKESLHEEQVSLWNITRVAMAKCEIQRTPNASLPQKIKNLRPPNIVRGFFYLNFICAAKLEQELYESIDPAKEIVSTQRVAVFQRETGAFDHVHSWQLFPYKLLAAIGVPNFSHAVQTFAFDQTKVNEARVASALERYRLARGSYPETLTELLPAFAEKLPHDIIGGQPLKYCHVTDSQFLLYSVGWDATDKVAQFNSGFEQGNWVWQ